jgi:hypothetical protein
MRTVIHPRGPLPVRRMTAHWVVLAAAALTTLVAAAVGAALAAFAGQSLPQAVRHDLAVAPGTSLVMVGGFNSGSAQATTAALRSAISAGLPGVPFGFWKGIWSDPLGFTTGSRPAKPAGLAAGNTPLLEAAALDDITRHAVLVAGAWPASAAPARGPIPAALPAASATLLGLRPGDVLRVQDRDTDAPLTFLVTGLYAERPSSSTDAYWQLNSVSASGSTTGGGFTTYGPLVVSPAIFSARLATATGTWVAQPDMAAFTGTDLSARSADVTAFSASLASSTALSGVQLSTSLPAVLAGISANLAVARALLAISALQLLVLALAALLAVARLLATQREAETALLTARGATRWQLTRLTAAEVIPLAVVTAAGGGVAGIWLARLLGGTLDSGAAGGGVSLSAGGTWLDVMAAALSVAVLAAGAMLFPVLRPAPAAAQVRRGRQGVVSGATRAGADLALIALAVLAGWQLRRYSAVSTSASGSSSIDPVLALAPALALAGGTVLTLRLLPAAARVADRLAARDRGLNAALAGWQFSRQPLRQGGAALLLVMAVATGTLALAQHQSWTRSTADQATQASGADVRVDLAAPVPAAAIAAVAGTHGVRTAMAVSVSPSTLPAEIVAIDAAKAARVVLLRADQSKLPEGALFTTITPASTAGGQVAVSLLGLPAIATKAFISANDIGVGAHVSATVNGVSVPITIAAEVSSFPTVTGGALIMDLPALQAFLAGQKTYPLTATQWWLATTDARVPASLARELPPGAAITSRTSLAAAGVADPLSAAPQQALLAMAVAAALLAITGFWVSIAANVRQRRAENALLAALGVGQRSAATQLFLEKLLLSVPSAALGLLLGTVVARLLVPAVTLTTTAQLPVPSPVTLFDPTQTVPLAAIIAVVPALAAALVVFRRPDPAAELRAAEAA